MIDKHRHDQNLATIISDASQDEVQRALIAYRAFNARRSTTIALMALQRLIDCDGCLGEHLRPGDNADEIRDQLRDICIQLQTER